MAENLAAIHQVLVNVNFHDFHSIVYGFTFTRVPIGTSNFIVVKFLGLPLIMHIVKHACGLLFMTIFSLSSMA